MSFMGFRLFRTVRHVNLIRQNAHTIAAAVGSQPKIEKSKEFRTEDNLVFLEDPDKFGTLSGIKKTYDDTLVDEDDIKEEQFLSDHPLRSQQLTIKQYSDLIKQYIEHKRLKEAIDVLEIRMLKEDRVKPSNYIYSILIGACADVGYTKKAFSLYNDMKRRALKVTGDVYTCLFEACANSPWIEDGLSRAGHLRNLMIEKGVEPNLTNYNAMIKAFGRCGDLKIAFKIADEMVSKKIKLRVHTLNHLLHACISDKDNGLRHALVVWRKMLKLREKPNIYTFNLMLKCVKECNLGSKEDIADLIRIIQEETPLAIESKNKTEVLKIESGKRLLTGQNTTELQNNTKIDSKEEWSQSTDKLDVVLNNPSTIKHKDSDITENSIAERDNTDNVEVVSSIQLVHKVPAIQKDNRTVPNLLSKKINLNEVLDLKEVNTAQEKFAIIGGLEDFLKEMKVYSVEPDLKIFTQMVMLLENSLEDENKLLELMKSYEIRADIDFYNMLIKKRCIRADYDSAIAVKELIEKENKLRKKKYAWKKLQLKPNVMTYGVLAMACRTKESAEQLLNEMKEKQLRVNIQILGSLLSNGVAQNNIDYVLYIMDMVKEENLKVNNIFLKHLEIFNNKCSTVVKMSKNTTVPEEDEIAFRKFSKVYHKWLKEVNVQEALQSEHPWQQFRESYPETVQRINLNIKEPKRFYKRNRKFIKYVPKI